MAIYRVHHVETVTTYRYRDIKASSKAEAGDIAETDIEDGEFDAWTVRSSDADSYIDSVEQLADPQEDMMGDPTIYYDGRQGYLELHAMRSPVGNYRKRYVDHPESYDIAVQLAIEDFEADHDCEILCLGRNGRHICLEDTPRNRERYDKLQALAIKAVKALWASMRTV